MTGPLLAAFFIGVLVAAVVMLVCMPAPPGLLGTEKPEEYND